MSQPERKKLTKSEAGRLGGLTTVDRHGAGHMAFIGGKGGDATVANEGRAGMARKAFKRHGRLPE